MRDVNTAQTRNLVTVLANGDRKLVWFAKVGDETPHAQTPPTNGAAPTPPTTTARNPNRCSKSKPPCRYPLIAIPSTSSPTSAPNANVSTSARPSCATSSCSLMPTRAGSEYIARIVTRQQRRLDRTLLEQRFGAEAVEQCCRLVAVTAIHLKPKGGPPSFQASGGDAGNAAPIPTTTGATTNLPICAPNAAADE